jgi:2-methylcitrate dehydratase PrpD
VYAIADALSAIRFDTLAARTVMSARRLVLDSLAVALAGSGCRDVQVLADLTAGWGGRPESTILGSERRVPAPVAALVNGTMIQALDFDDTHDPSGAHTASTVLAAALAVAEARHRSGRDLIAAVTAGVELAGRIGLACTDKIGWTSTAVYGAFGAAAAAAHALRLSAEQTRHALGIVISQAAGTTQTAVDSPLSKHMQSGFAAKAGVLSALLAEQGVTGVDNVFEGKFGFFPLYKANRYRLEPLMADWGGHYEIDALSLKPFPSCRATHAAIEATLALAAAHSLRAGDVARVRVVVPPVAHNLTGKPFVEGSNPMISAQFSLQYTVATALHHGSVSLRHFTLDAIRNPAIRALMERITVAVEDGGEFAPARVEVHTTAGRDLHQTVSALKGGPDCPLTDDELLAKIEDCLTFAPPGTTVLDAKALQRRVDDLDTITDVGDLAASLVGAPFKENRQS